MQTPQQYATYQGNVLVVDDHLDRLRFLTELLTKHGYQVRSVINGKMALMVLRFFSADVVLVNIALPQMDGYEVCRAVKDNPATAQIPVIFMGGIENALDWDMVKAFAMGGVDYVTHPFVAMEVVARVKTHVTLRQLQQQLVTKNQLLEIQNQQLRKEIGDRIIAETALHQANRTLNQLAHQDELTQIANRRRFDDYLRQAWQAALHHRLSLSLLLCDVDYFKRYNDTYGHQQGDACLRKIARILAQRVPKGGLVARYGGEEFAVILPNHTGDQAMQFAQGLKEAIAQLQIAHTTSDVSAYVTLSLGISSTVPQGTHAYDELVVSADHALYMAKGEGRDRYCYQPLVNSYPTLMMPSYETSDRPIAVPPPVF